MYRKIIKAVSVILSVTMLMGITVFADTITDLQNQKNQKEKEIDNIEDELAYVMLQMDELEISMAENEVGKEISGIRIRHIDELEAFCEENKPKVAVLCVPRDGAEQVSGRLVDLGIEGFWNFSHYDLSVPYPDVVVENVHLGDSLMSLGYRLRNQE